MLQKDRKGVVAILTATRKNPSSGAGLIPVAARSMKKILQLADIEPSLSTYPLQIAGLTAIYSLTLCTWLRDETRDISKTMASLDRMLTQAERIMEFMRSRK